VADNAKSGVLDRSGVRAGVPLLPAVAELTQLHR
jgi:hypothetical protein